VKSIARQGVRFGIQANLDPKKTENYSGSVAESQASVVNAPIVFGSRKIYEITVELGKAWLPALSPWAADGYHPARDGDDKESLYYSRYVVGGSAFGTGQMAGRLWDANTDGRYDKWALTRRDVAALATAGNDEVWPAMPHKPLPLFSWINDLSNQVVRAWAEYSTAGSARQRLIAGWRMLTDRIGLYITQKDLADIVPAEYADKFAGNFFQAIIDNAAAVRVWLTCAIKGPHRLMHSVARSPQSGSAFSQVAAFDRGQAGEFRFSQAGAGSPTLAGILVAKNHDGTADLVRAATRIAEVAQDRAAEATFELPWPEPEISIGDRIEKLEGLEYSFGINAGAARRYPRVVGLTYGLTPGNYNTQIVLESERKAGRI
ncbi:MAG TPA: hypothetical protein VM695_04865, partial [Phycisphaerae bacterium]|nr:hypothetical protein [Phycisphaerae bacterium]